MKILTWNCNRALRNKFNNLLDFIADIIVIQECKNLAENYLWIGDTKNKGIGIFAKKNIELKKLNWSDNIKDQNEN